MGEGRGEESQAGIMMHICNSSIKEAKKETDVWHPWPAEHVYSVCPRPISESNSIQMYST